MKNIQHLLKIFIVFLLLSFSVHAHDDEATDTEHEHTGSIIEDEEIATSNDNPELTEGQLAPPKTLEPLISDQGPGDIESNPEDNSKNKDIDTGWLESISTKILNWFKSWF